jgi:NTE family protein
MIVPKLTVWRYAHVTANPKMEAVQRFIREGERATWKRIEMVRNQMLIAQTLERCLRRLEPQRLNASVRKEAARKPNLSVVRNKDG